MNHLLHCKVVNIFKNPDIRHLLKCYHLANEETLLISTIIIKRDVYEGISFSVPITDPLFHIQLI